MINDTAANGTIKFRRYNVSTNPQPITKEGQLLKSTLGISANDSLTLVAVTKDTLGFTHKFYLQYYKGIKVEHANYATHSRNGIIEIINGEFAKVGNPVVLPSISETEALSSALKYINAQQYRWQIPAEENTLKTVKNDTKATYYPKGELVICYDYMQTKTYRLAYKFTINAYLPVSTSSVFVDAITGNVIARQNLLLDGNISTTVTTKYSGSQSITTDQFTSGGTTMYRLQETRGTSNVSIQSFNSQRIQSTAHVDFSDANNTWTTSNNANMDNAALDTHWAMEKIYDYWNSVRGRNSYDGTGAAMISFVHYNIPYLILNGVPQYHTGTDNSSWDLANHQVYLGDGVTHFNPLTSFDVCAHEFGHAFTEGAQPALFNTHGILINADGMHPEALALNEGISDIWGAVVENWATTGKQTWEMGEDIMKDGKPCLRSLQNPKTGGDNSSDLTPTGGYPDTYQKNYWYSSSNLNPNDGGKSLSAFAHTNSTLISHWFYLLSVGGSGTNDLSNFYSVTGIGITKAASIVWRAEQNYLGANSQYTDARTAMLNAAIDLFCTNSPEVAAVTNAWYAVGVGTAYSGNVMSISGPDYLCTTGSYTIANQPSGISSIVWSSSNNSIATINSTSGNATKVDNGNTDVSAIVTGTSGCSTTTLPKLVTVGTGIPVTGTYNSPSNSSEILQATPTPPPGHLIVPVYNPACMYWAANLRLPSGYSASWSLSQSDPGVTWGQSGNTLWCQFSAVGQEAWFSAEITTSCGSYSLLYIFKCTTLSTCGIQPQFVPNLPSSRQQFTVMLSPNPTHNILHVSLKGTAGKTQQRGIAELQVIDNMGHIRLTRKTGLDTRGSANIEVGSLPQGVYLIRVSDGSNWATGAFMKE